MLFTLQEGSVSRPLLRISADQEGRETDRRTQRPGPGGAVSPAGGRTRRRDAGLGGRAFRLLLPTSGPEPLVPGLADLGTKGPGPPSGGSRDGGALCPIRRGDWEGDLTISLHADCCYGAALLRIPSSLLLQRWQLIKMTTVSPQSGPAAPAVHAHRGCLSGDSENRTLRSSGRYKGTLGVGPGHRAGGWRGHLLVLPLPVASRGRSLSLRPAPC